jgi:hypothetical protein
VAETPAAAKKSTT